MCLYINVCVWLHVTAIQTLSLDLDPLQEIRIDARYGPNTLAIRKSIHGMIRRLVPVRAVKTRRRFESEIASFHVSVYSHVFSLFTVASSIHVSIRIISCYYMTYFTSMIIRTISYDISDCTLYVFR